MRWARHTLRVGERRCVYRVLVRRPDGKRHLGRPRRRWVVNIKGNGGDMDWIYLAQDRNRWRALLNGAMILQVP
jgi:hypothetical protein